MRRASVRLACERPHAMAEDPALALAPYVRRAEELASLEPRVAYYVRLYALQRGMVRPAPALL